MRNKLLVVLVSLCLLTLGACSGKREAPAVDITITGAGNAGRIATPERAELSAEPGSRPWVSTEVKNNEISPGAPGAAKVYFTGDISGRGLLAIYKALGVPVSGKVAIKMHMGEPGNTNYLQPGIIKPLADELKASLVDSNTYYGGSRGTTAGHLQAAKDHGFTFATVDILDSQGEVRLPIKNGKHQKEAILGSHIMNYDWIISVAHFKGHSQAGFGGTFKNLAIGIATPEGKGSIHNKISGGRFNENGDPFFEKIVEYNQALMDAKPGKLIYINVLNNLSTSCDCDARAPKALMGDIGILASTDPVALEKASLDQIYNSPEEGKRHLIERIESRGGVHQIIYAEQVGLGSQQYELVRLQ
ncbi:MAG: DUF362 domain-containing protein [Treponema sp.]|jgi:uncharacterized Fe-S center protein|nr:DUF362 domain-containing protein [Treponema sp.]